MSPKSAQGRRAFSDSIGRKHSVAAAKEILRDIGVPDGMDFICYPDTGVWRIDTLSFRASKTTDLILKRPETATFPVFAKFCDHHITGETICDLSDGTPAITVEDQTLRFRFDPFAMYLTNMNEGFRNSRMSSLKWSALVMYWHMPPRLRKTVNWFSRRYETSHVHSLKDLELLGVGNNVIVHLIEQHMLDTGLLRKHRKPPLAVMTHDIDTQFCQTEGREVVSSAERDLGVHATWFFVPRSVQYSLDRGGVRSLMEEGHEIGMHGFTHGGELALYNAAKLAKQLRKGKEILESIGAKVESFRSPYTLRSSILLPTLASEGFKVDSSYTDAKMLGMTGGPRGLSYNRPFKPLVVRDDVLIEPLPLWEVPIPGPQDVHLVESLRVTDQQLLRVWKYKVDFCRDLGGVFVLLSHPVHIVKHIEAFAKLLRYVRSEGFRFTTMKELPSYWSRRNNQNTEGDQ